MVMIKVKNLNFSYGEKAILKNISFEIQKGESVAVIGPNGSGKSTLLNCLNGLNTVVDETVFINNADINSLGNELYYLTSTLFQNPDNQFVTLSVEDELAFALENRNVSLKEMEKRVEEVLLEYNLERIARHSPEQLSGGEKQLTALASSLITKPAILFLDEPTTMLDRKGKRAINKHVFDKVNNTEMIIVMITHNPEEAILCDNLIVISDGEIIYRGKTGDVYRNYYKEIIKLGLDLPWSIIARERDSDFANK